MHRLLTLFLIGATALSAAPKHATLLREAGAAAKAGDNATALAKMEEAAQLRPDYPRVQINLARLYAAQQRPDAALAALQRLADMGLQMNVAADPGLAALKELPRFQTLAQQLAVGPDATAASDEASFALTDVTGIIESCLVDPETLVWYFGDVRNRCIWVRDVSSGTAQLRKFTHDDDALDGVFKIALSADRKTLWAATATVGVMTGSDAEDGKRTALVAIDFATGRVRARYPVPADGRNHLLGDFVIAADGSLYATDSVSSVIWRLPAGGTALEPWLESDEFLSLQGIALDSAGQHLCVADYANGIWRIATDTKTPTLLTAPANATFFGIDGLYAVPGGILAVQNGVNPQRVLRIDLPSGKKPLVRAVAQGRPAMTDLALGQVFNGRFHFVGNSGWALFDPPPTTPPAARTVTILSTAVE
ncbi:tetratricopeptide repeat protein [Oleiharenicola lentus]|uniref:Tetratricopeptide repeat protein n=1 Tax=Oleiharenicola lentus TaxID=2508720 RepID=A0A4Q1CAN5_9BACT|nr:tetratricopeptide repeat protein [Oleiharenicola lentus]RXK56157.1 tetratricopeptide repeat protein [Oleiharenicola lentus]